ncbi:hypothetical protein HWV62_40635 [Athelia sp. TMB]|nr:hypothetical protein HWV62_40635 [Athelia sp. TMB]
MSGEPMAIMTLATMYEFHAAVAHKFFSFLGTKQAVKDGLTRCAGTQEEADAAERKKGPVEDAGALQAYVVENVVDGEGSDVRDDVATGNIKLRIVGM